MKIRSMLENNSKVYLIEYSLFRTLMIKEYLEHLLLKESFIIQNLLTQDLF